MIGIIGLNHKTAPLPVREKFAFNSDESTALAQRITGSKYIDEAVVLATCNRTEVYFKSNECCSTGAFSIVRGYLTEYAGIEADIAPYFYEYRHDAAVRHLFRVVSSLDSMVLGEYQIVSQVKEAFHLAADCGAAGPIFKRLADRALETGKTVRTKTALSEGAFSVSYAAVQKCAEQFGALDSRSVLLVGAGETGELVVKNLCKKGCRNITIVNRTPEHAQALADKYCGRMLPLSALPDAIHAAEIIITSVTTKEPLFDSEHIRPHLNGFPQVLMLDLGIPRNINPDVGMLPGVSLLNIDDLQAVVAGNQAQKQTCIAVAEDIINAKTGEFADWLNSRTLAPIIHNIVEMGSRLCAKEIATLQAAAPADELPLLKRQAQRLAEKWSNEMIKTLKIVSDNGRKTECVKVINDFVSETARDN
ncbi:MAG: glutamyl-tRNA reductase [Bacteroidales bacterium]|jgi:glutamyl-tRNA reductase|nr:glutamyl-tRNA reductase [Bacteroidales bacterium]